MTQSTPDPSRPSSVVHLRPAGGRNGRRPEVRGDRSRTGTDGRATPVAGETVRWLGLIRPRSPAAHLRRRPSSPSPIASATLVLRRVQISTVGRTRQRSGRIGERGRTGGSSSSTNPSTEVLSVSVTSFTRATRREIQNIVQRVSRVRERPPQIQVPKRGVRVYRLREPLPSGVGRNADGSLIRPTAVSGRVLERAASASHRVHRNRPRRTAVTDTSSRRRAPRRPGPRADIRTTGRRGRVRSFWA